MRRRDCGQRFIMAPAIPRRRRADVSIDADFLETLRPYQPHEVLVGPYIAEDLVAQLRLGHR